MDNFDLKKFLKENKAFENLNPTIKSLNESTDNLRAKIKEMIIAELGTVEEETDTDLMDPVEENGGEDYELEDRKVKYGINPEIGDTEYEDYFFDINTPEEDKDLEEAKKKKDKDIEDVEDVEMTDTEDISLDDIPTSEETPEPSTGGGLKDIAADMKGTEADLMDHLMKSFQIAKGMNNEKLETQVGNTLKFFVSEYIGGGQD